MSWDFLNSEAFGVLVSAAVMWLGNKLWDKSSDKAKEKLSAAISEARAVVTQIVLTARPDATVNDVIEWAKGASAVQLAKLGLKNDNPVIKPLLNQIIAEAVQLFIERHPDPKTLSPPVMNVPEPK